MICFIMITQRKKYLKKEPDLTPYELVEQIRREIFESTQLTASAGKIHFICFIYIY